MGDIRKRNGGTRKRHRLRRELELGRDGRPLKAVEVLTRANELLSLGETLGSLRALDVKAPRRPKLDDEAVALIRETQRVYRFDPRAWRLLGVDLNRIDAR